MWLIINRKECCEFSKFVRVTKNVLHDAWYTCTSVNEVVSFWWWTDCYYQVDCVHDVALVLHVWSWCIFFCTYFLAIIGDSDQSRWMSWGARFVQFFNLKISCSFLLCEEVLVYFYIWFPVFKLFRKNVQRICLLSVKQICVAAKKDFFFRNVKMNVNFSWMFYALLTVSVYLWNVITILSWRSTFMFTNSAFTVGHVTPRVAENIHTIHMSLCMWSNMCPSVKAL